MIDHKNIVKYHNDMNEITFQRFNQVDFDFFMALCSKLRDSKDSEVVISFKDFKKLSGYSPKTSGERFVNELQAMNHKQLMSQGKIRRGKKTEQFVLFTKFVIDEEEKNITAKVNEDYRYILNEVTKNFTRFELEEFVNLDGKYTKTLYRLLKQFRTTGLYRVSLEEFKRVMSVPESYTNMKIGQKILNPSVNALKPYFKDLDCKVLYEAKRGRPVKGYEFRFTPEQIPRQLQEKEEKKEKSQNRFHNFRQRDYNFDEIEKKLRMKR